MWQVCIHSGYYEVSCPTPCSDTHTKWMHSLKFGREAKACPVLWAYLKKQEEGGRYKKVDPCQCPLCINKPFQSRCTKKTLWWESGGGSPTHRAVNDAGKQCLTQSPLPGPRATLIQESLFKSSSQSYFCLIAWVVQFLEIGQSVLLEQACVHQSPEATVNRNLLRWMDCLV